MIKFILKRRFSTAYKSTDRVKPDLKKELTFNKFGLLNEITSVLGYNFAIETPSAI